MRQTYVCQGPLNHLSQPINLVFASTHIVVCHVWLFLHLHHRYGGIDLRRQRDLYLELLTIDTNLQRKRNEGETAESEYVQKLIDELGFVWGGGMSHVPNPHAFFNVCRSYPFTQPHDVFPVLLCIDNILGVLLPCVDDFGAPRDLQPEKIKLNKMLSYLREFAHQ